MTHRDYEKEERRIYIDDLKCPIYDTGESKEAFSDDDTEENKEADDDAGPALLVIQKIMVMMLKTIVVMMTRVG